MENEIYHVCTRGLEKDLWFWDKEDYVHGMNSIPVCAIVAEVTVYCFCLMSNHVHFVLKGSRENSILFLREYKRLRSRQMALKYKGEHSIDGSQISISHVDDMNYLQTVVAYVMRNPMAAGMKVIPTEYPWSSSNLYFAGRSFADSGFKRLGDLSISRKRLLFKTKMQLPDDYQVDENGIIFPGSYVDFRAVERIFGYPQKLLYCLSSTKDIEAELMTGILTKANYNDSELRVSLDVISEEKFHGRKYSMLKIEDRYRAARELKKRYGIGLKQLARITSLDVETLKTLVCKSLIC